MPIAAVGQLIQKGVLFEQPVKDSNGVYQNESGGPLIDVEALAALAAPTAATGASGAITTAGRRWKISQTTLDMAESLPSVTTAAVALTAQKGALTVIPAPTDARVMWVNIYAAPGTATVAAATTDPYGFVGRITHYEAAGTTYTGAGLNDLTSGGTYSAVGSDGVFEIEITTEGTPDVFKWRYNGGSYTTGVSITGSAQTLSNGVTITFGATTGHTLGDVWRVVVWTTKFNDNVVNPDFSKKPRTVSQVGVNLNLRGIWPDATTEMADQKLGATTELRGNIGPSRYYPAEKDFAHDQKLDYRAGVMAFNAEMQLGEPTTITAIKDTPVFIYQFTPSHFLFKPLTYADLLWEGAVSLTPEMFLGLRLQARNIKVTENKIVTVDTKPFGTQSTRVGVGTPTSVTGTYWDNRRPVVRGVPRSDLTTFYVKVSTALTGSTVGIKASTDGSTYGTEMLIGVDTGAGNIQVRRSGNPSPWVELFDEDGLSMGLYEGENREPLGIYFAGDLSTLAVDDIMTFTVNGLAIPGLGSSPYSGYGLRHESEFRETSAFFNFLRGATNTTPDTLVELLEGEIDIMWTQQIIRELDQEVKTPKGYDRTDVLKFTVKGKRRYDSRVYQDIVNYDDRLAVQIGFLGAPIISSPGVALPNYKRGTIWTVPQFCITETPKRSIPNRNVITEEIQGIAEQPDDEEQELLTETTYTDRLWLPPGVSLTLG